MLKDTKQQGRNACIKESRLKVSDKVWVWVGVFLSDVTVFMLNDVRKRK